MVWVSRVNSNVDTQTPFYYNPPLTREVIIPMRSHQDPSWGLGAFLEEAHFGSESREMRELPPVNKGTP
jgi:hypothetical protein